MKRKLPCILATACLAVLLPSQAAAAVTLVATDDNYVYTGDEDMNYQYDSPVFTVKNATSNDRIAYVKFDLSSVISSIDTNQDATLNLTFNQVTNAGSGDTAEFTFDALSNVSPNNEDWLETTVTYNTRPTGTYINLGSNYDWSYNASNVSHSITFSNIADYIQTDNTITIKVFGPQLGDTGNNPSFHSKDSPTEAYHPTLVLAQVPEPAAASLLLGVSVLTLIGLRRRRQ
tara:strand:+ start:220 stop:912 length:693 start_codon:yes stop_codon:yes gene_type:complete